MKLYLMQHGNSVSKEEDPERPLSVQGTGDVKKVAGFLQNAGIMVEEVFHSGKMRARQTAEIVISLLNPHAELTEKGELAPLNDVRDILEQIKKRKTDLLIVGHLPHLAKLVSMLILGTESTQVVSFQQGGVACLSKDPRGEWTLAWMLVPEIF